MNRRKNDEKVNNMNFLTSYRKILNTIVCFNFLKFCITESCK